MLRPPSSSTLAPNPAVLASCLTNGDVRDTLGCQRMRPLIHCVPPNVPPSVHSRMTGSGRARRAALSTREWNWNMPPVAMGTVRRDGSCAPS